MNRAVAHSSVIPATPTRGVIVRNPWARNVLIFLMVFGPGLIVMEADNDAGAVSTYVQAGAQYGTNCFGCCCSCCRRHYFIQEMVIRLGIATGKGHAAMIYSALVSGGAVLARRSGNGELPDAGHGVRRDSLAVSTWNLSVPGSSGGSDRPDADGADRKLSPLGADHGLPVPARFAWLAVAVRLHPGGGEMVHDTLVPIIPKGGITGNLIFLVIAIVGTTIAPWQLFFQQSCIADKRLRFSDLKWARLDTLIGATSRSSSPAA